MDLGTVPECGMIVFLMIKMKQTLRSSVLGNDLRTLMWKHPKSHPLFIPLDLPVEGHMATGARKLGTPCMGCQPSTGQKHTQTPKSNTTGNLEMPRQPAPVMGRTCKLRAHTPKVRFKPPNNGNARELCWIFLLIRSINQIFHAPHCFSLKPI